MKIYRFYAPILLTILLTGCSGYPFLYHAPLSQGNVPEPGAYAQLQPGMNKAQVVNLVGMPILQTPFSANTWSYVYLLREHGKVVKQQQINLHFKGEKLVSLG